MEGHRVASNLTIRLRTIAVASLTTVSAWTGTGYSATAAIECGAEPEAPVHHLLPANSETVHWKITADRPNLQELSVSGMKYHC